MGEGRKRVALWGAGGATVIGLVLVATTWLGPWWHERAMRSVPRPLNVLLVTLDTTRADHLGCYGWPHAETPYLDTLAKQGTIFRQAYSHVPLTLPSHASLLTGLLPTRHGVRDNGTFVLPNYLTILPERFREAGYRSGAFVSAFVLDRRFGLSRGFDTYVDEVPGADAANEGDPSGRSVRAGETVEKALAWLAAADARAQFLWVHLFDPHAPYEPPEPFAGRHPDRPYDGEIAYMDAQVGRLLAALGTRPQGRPWLTAVVGDHGEGLGDHQEITHGYFVYSNTQRVPLMFALPGHVPAGRAVEEVVRGVDVAPTILELAGLPALPDADGGSLVRLIAGSGGEPGPAYLESYHPRFWWGAQELFALRTAQWLFVESPRPELYDVSADPGERNNLAGTHPQELESLRLRLRGYARAGAHAESQARLDSEAEARLRALGYLGPGRSDPKPGSELLPDAKDNGPLLETVTRGHDLAVQGRHEEALARFNEALQKNPRSVSVRMRVAETLLSLVRRDEAFAAYAEVAATRFAPDTAHLGMSMARLGQGRIDEALAATRAGLEVAPDSVRLNAHLGELLLQRKKPGDAEQAFRKALAVVPQDEAARWGLGVALSRNGRKQESVAVLLGLAEDSPRSPQARAAAEALLVWAEERLDARAPQEARRGYEAVLRTGRASVAIFLNLGLAAWQSNLRSGALEVLERGLARFPDSPDLLYRQGRVLEQLGRGTEAEAAFRRVLELAPGRADAAAALRRRRDGA